MLKKIGFIVLAIAVLTGAELLIKFYTTPQFFSIFNFMLGGIASLHIIRIQKLDVKNPNLPLKEILWVYWCQSRFFIMLSVIGWVVFANLLNLGLAETIAAKIIGLNFINASDLAGIRFVSFMVGLLMEWLLSWLSKRGKNSPEQTLERKAFIEKANEFAAGDNKQ